MKAYTDLEQSHKLAEILPLESADMYYLAKPDNTNSNMVTSDICIPRRSENDGQAFGEACAWSLAALLDNIPQVKLDSIKQYDKKHWRCCAYFASDWHNSDWCDNPIDACYEMVLRLNELNLL